MIRSLAAAAAAFAVSTTMASDRVSGDSVTFTSPNGLEERCLRITPIPGGNYSKGDREDEAGYCDIDFYDSKVALCPKTWSTSPGMMVYDISSGPYAGKREAFQRKACREGKSAERYSAGDLAKYKTTMNAKGTSGTYAPSSLLYYHFSRYFDTTVRVPVAVWRSMDAGAHLEEVAEAGLALSGGSHGGRMNHAGWEAFVKADRNPSSYSPTDDLFTSDRKQIYGVLLSSPGHRYGSEINGTRKSGWGKGQNRDFQETPAFLALRSEKPLEAAIAQGLAEGRKDRQIAKDLGPDVAPQQMVYWMKELTEIVLLDFIFSQQDRVGNIDFTPYYYWLENGERKHARASHHKPRDGTVPADALLLHRTNLNDNDAGGRVQYANFAKSTGMLEKLRHMDEETYRRLLALDRDLRDKGDVYRWLESSLGLSAREVRQVVDNTAMATQILRSTCQKGKMRFDLHPREFFEKGKVTPAKISCDAP
ncbi:MAG: hypothetical protein P8Z78_06035 [Gammaproteobacteria bacterium]|jgi:hypothetical protein